jgi:phage-related minor tail protein
MADRIKGITVEIGGDATKLSNALKDVNKQSRLLQGELKDVERLLKLDPTNTEALAQKQLLLQRALDNTKEKLNTLKEAQAQVQAQFDRGELPEDQYRAFMREIGYTENQLRGFERRLAEVNRAEDTTGTNTRNLAKTFEEAGNKVKASGKKFKDAGESIKEAGEKGAGVTAAITGIGVGAVASAINLDKAHGQMISSLGVTEQKALELEGVAKNVWKSGFGEDLSSATDAVSNLYAVLGDKVPATELEGITKGVMTLSQTFGTDVTENVTAMRTVMTNFGVDGQTALDLITTASQKTGGVFRTDLADALTELSPTLQGMGATGTQAFNLMIQASKSGMENFDALSSLTQTFNDNLIGGGKNVEAAFASMGGKAQEMWGKYKDGSASAYDVMMATTQQLGSMKDKQKANTDGAQLFGDVWTEASAKAIEGLGGASGAADNYTGAMKRAADANENTFGQRLQGTLRGFGEAMAPLGGVILDLADRALPYLEAAVARLVGWFQGLSEPMQNAIVIFGVIAAVIPILLVVFGTLASAVGNIIMVVGMLIEFLPVLGGAFAVLAGPVGIVIGIIAALIAIGVLLWQNWDKIKEKAASDWAELVAGVKAMGQRIKQHFNEAVQDIKDIWGKVEKFFKGIDLKKIGSDIMTGLKNGIASAAQKIYDKASEIAGKVVKTLKNAFISKSPSKLTIEIGQDVGEGLRIGLQDSIQPLAQTSIDVANNVIGAMSKYFAKGDNTLTNYFEAIQEDGDYLNDMLVHMPKQVANVAREMGKLLAPSLEGTRIQDFNKDWDGNNKYITVTLNSPKALDVREANRQFTNTMNRMSNLW